MNLENMTMTVRQALPAEFDFYDQGKVKIHDTLDLEVSADSVGVAFSIYPMDESHEGFRSVLLAVFAPGLDKDFYTEMGNIIASRFATQIGNELEEPTMVTPPLFLKNAAVTRLIRLKDQVLSKNRYHHTHDGQLTPVDVFVLKVKGIEEGHA